MILQTFSDESLVKLKEAFPRRIPTCFLLWLGNDVSDLKQNTPEQYAAKINFGIENGAVIMGPSIAGAPNHYDELLSPGNGELIYRSGMAIHPYSFDTVEQMEEYTGLKAGQPAQNRADGMFTNKVGYDYPVLSGNVARKISEVECNLRPAGSFTAKKEAGKG